MNDLSGRIRFAKHKYILLAFLIVILMALPALILWSPNITGSDSAIYMETARNMRRRQRLRKFNLPFQHGY
jgi:hypothetical protein